jgi:hypothetical protein
MMQKVTIPYSGTLLVTHLAAYGLATVLDAAGIDAFVAHDAESQSFEPVVAFPGDLDTARRAIRSSAKQLEPFVERDVEPGKTGNDRRSAMWARISLAKGHERLAQIIPVRQELVAQADESSRLAACLVAGVGAPAVWGPETMKTSAGATALDGVLGNHTSDLVRGVLRWTRRSAAELDPDPFSIGAETPLPADKTGWAPPGSLVDYVHQWLAAIGLSMLPVAHRPLDRSATPACWTRRDGGRRDGVTLPLLGEAVSVPRLRVLLGLKDLTRIAGEPDLEEPEGARAAGRLRAYGVAEVVVFERRNRAGSGTSVAFDFTRGTRVPVR